MASAISAFEKNGFDIDDVVLRQISGNISGSASSVGSYAFAYCYSLTTVSFPNCSSIGANAFYSCSNLTAVSFPNCTSISGYAFGGCRTLTTANFPNCLIIGGTYAFFSCVSLTIASFPRCTNISTYAFSGCNNLLSLYLNEVSSVTSLGASVFTGTPIGGRTTSTGGVYGSVFVPASLLTSFKTATNWASISARIVGV